MTPPVGALAAARPGRRGISRPASVAGRAAKATPGDPAPPILPGAAAGAPPAALVVSGNAPLAGRQGGGVPAACLAVADQRQRHRQQHEHRGRPEHPARHAVVHDPAEQHRPDRAADAEPHRDDAEGAPARTSMSREGMIMPDRKPASPIVATSSTEPRPTMPIASTSTALTTKLTAATSAWRSVMSAINPPASTPKAVKARYAVSAILASANGTR